MWILVGVLWAIPLDVIDAESVVQQRKSIASKTDKSLPVPEQRANMDLVELRPQAKEGASTSGARAARNLSHRWRVLPRAEGMIAKPKRINYTALDPVEEVREYDISNGAQSKVRSDKPFRNRRNTHKVRMEKIQSNSSELGSVIQDSQKRKKKKKKKQKRA